MALGSVTFGSGLASGLDFGSIIDALIKADSQPISTLQTRVDGYNKAKQAFSGVQSRLSDLQSKLQAMHDSTAVGGKIGTVTGLTNGATAPFTIDTASSALTGNYQVRVETLAKSHRVKSDKVGDAYSPVVSDGTITIKSGNNDTITVNVSAAEGNNSLQAIAQAINKADKGVLATVIQDNTGAMLMVKSEETGTSNALTITDSTNLNLVDAGNLVQAAQNAKVWVDDIAVTSQSNAVYGAIPGVTLNLTATNTTAVSVSIAEDVDATKEALRNLVTSYNSLNDQFVQQLGSATAEKNSPVASNAVFRGIQSEMLSLITTRIGGIAEGSADSLAELGIQVADKTGKLEFKESVFDDLVEQGKYDQVKAVLQSSGSTSSSQVAYLSSLSTTKAGTYDLYITQAAQQAIKGGSAAVSGSGLAADENLTIDVNGTSKTVALAAGDKIDAIITKVNQALSDAGVAAFADSDGGKLRIRSRQFGTDQSLKVYSDKADAGDGSTTGMGTSQTAVLGVDVAGTINGVAATGAGRDLTANSGDASGLTVRIYATPESVGTGKSFGTIGYSQGAADTILQKIKQITDPLDGTIHSALESYDASIKTVNEKIKTLQDHLTVKRELLTKQFSAAEQAISQLNAMMASLSKTS